MAGARTFTVIHVALLVHEVVGDGIFVHDTSKNGLSIAYNIFDLVSKVLYAP